MARRKGPRVSLISMFLAVLARLTPLANTCPWPRPWTHGELKDSQYVRLNQGGPIWTWLSALLSRGLLNYNCGSYQRPLEGPAAWPTYTIVQKRLRASLLWYVLYHNIFCKCIPCVSSGLPVSVAVAPAEKEFLDLKLSSLSVFRPFPKFLLSVPSLSSSPPLRSLRATQETGRLSYPSQFDKMWKSHGDNIKQRHNQIFSPLSMA